MPWHGTEPSASAAAIAVASRLCKEEDATSVSPHPQEGYAATPLLSHREHHDDEKLVASGTLERRKIWQIPCTFCRADFTGVDELILHLKKKTCAIDNSSSAALVLSCPFASCSYQPGRKTVTPSGHNNNHTNTSWSQCLSILANHIRSKHTLAAESTRRYSSIVVSCVANSFTRRTIGSSTWAESTVCCRRKRLSGPTLNADRSARAAKKNINPAICAVSG